jgi:hypothetical protein
MDCILLPWSLIGLQLALFDRSRCKFVSCRAQNGLSWTQEPLKSDDEALRRGRAVGT